MARRLKNRWTEARLIRAIKSLARITNQKVDFSAKNKKAIWKKLWRSLKFYD